MSKLSQELHEERKELLSRPSFLLFLSSARYYKEDPSEWALHNDGDVAGGVSSDVPHRPYFEVLIVAPNKSHSVERNVKPCLLSGKE
ncbi:hypothetical protein [Alishewanella longhuensis]